MKEKIKNIFKCIGVFFLAWLYVFWISGAIEVVISNLTGIKIDGIALFISLIIIPIVCAIIIVILYGISLKNVLKETWFKRFLTDNSKRLCILFFILAGCYLSLKGEATFTRENTGTLLTIQWMIFTISSALFGVWAIQAKKQISDNEPVSKNNNAEATGINAILKMHERKQYVSVLSDIKYCIILLIMNLALLVCYTTVFYLYLEIEGYLFQLISVLSFYFCLQTIINVFMNTITPLLVDTIVKINAYKKTLKEENKLIDKALKQEMVKYLIEKTKNDSLISIEEKSKAIEIFKSLLIEDDSIKGENK